MIYQLMIYKDGRLEQVITVEGLEKAQAARDLREKDGYDVELEPDTFAYIKKYHAKSRKPRPAA